MKTIDKTQLPGKYKTWMYKHGLLPRLIWPLTLYEIPTTAVEVIERRVNKHLRRWLGVPSGFTNIGFYMKTTKLQLLEEFTVSMTRLVRPRPTDTSSRNRNKNQQKVISEPRRTNLYCDPKLILHSGLSAIKQ